MPEETPQSTLRYRDAVRQRAYHQMSCIDPVERAEIIARHYLAHAQIAQNIICGITAMRQPGQEGKSRDLRSMILLLAEEIARDHSASLGIDLDYSK
jgi:hypothetical protein